MNQDVVAALQNEISDLQRQVAQLRAERASQPTADMQAVLDAIPSPVFTKDREGRYQICNRFFADTLGLPPQEILGKTSDELYPPALAAVYHRQDAELLENPRVYVFADTTFQLNGQQRQAEIHKAPLYNDDGQVVGLGCIIYDVTERMLAERHLRRQNEYFSLLHETSLGLLDRLRVDDLLNNILAQACRIFGTEQGYIYLVEPGGEYMEMKVGTGIYQQRIGDRRPPGRGIAGKTWEGGLTIYLDDYLSWPYRNSDVDFDRVHSAIALPLKSTGRVIGVLGLDYYDCPHRFDEEELSSLARLADLASLAMDNANLYSESRRELAERQRQNRYLSLLHETTLGLINRLDQEDLLNKIVDQISLQAETPHVFLQMIDPECQLLEMKIGRGLYRGMKGIRRPIGFGMCGQLWETGKMVVVEDYCKWSQRHPDPMFDIVRSTIALPLKSADKIIGVISIDYTQLHSFGEAEVSWFERMAQLASLALDNAVLYSSAQRELAERKQMEAALAVANDQLEAKVELRTQELMAMNQELTATNQELFNALAELRMAQDQLVQSEKMAALGMLVAGVAHEINTPIGIGVMLASHLELETKGLRQLLDAGKLKKEQLHEFLQECDESTIILLTNLRRAAQLVHGFKQVSVDQISETRRIFSVKEYLEDIIRSLQAQFKRTKHQIRTNCDEMLMLNGYPGALAQVVTNLVMNSLIHGFSPDQEGVISIDVQERNGQCEIIYRDNGRGMEAEVLSRIFDPFFTTNRGGGSTGLGLHVVFNIITQKFGGTVRCESTPNQGAVFTICFPATYTDKLG